MKMRSIRVSHILLSTEELAAMIHSTLKEIEDNRDLLFKMFKKLATKYSACASRNKGGDIGFIEFNTNARVLEEAAMATPVGVVGGPIKSQFGYHVFLVTEEEQLGDLGIDGLHSVSIK